MSFFLGGTISIFSLPLFKRFLKFFSPKIILHIAWKISSNLHIVKWLDFDLKKLVAKLKSTRCYKSGIWLLVHTSSKKNQIINEIKT